MAEPYDSAVSTGSVTNAIWEENNNVPVELYMRLRGKTEGLFPISDRAFTGEAFRRKIVHAPYTGARTSAQRGSLPAPAGFDRETFTINRDDLTRVTASIRINEEDLRAAVGDENATIDLVEDSVRQIRESVPNRVAIAMHGKKSGLLALINGTPTDEDGTTYTSGQEDSRFAIDNGSIAYFLAEDLELEVRAPGAGSLRVAAGVKVEDVYVESKEITVSSITAGQNHNAVADNDELYFKGEGANNTGMLGFDHWYQSGRTLATTADDVYGKVRTAATIGHRKWVPNEFSGGNDQLILSDIDTALVPLGYFNSNMDVQGDKLVRTKNLVFTADIDMTNRIMDLMDSSKRVMVPATRENSRLVADSGFDGLIHHNPITGPLHFTGDQFSPPNVVRIIDPSSWEWVMLGRPGFLTPPGAPRAQIWKQIVDTGGTEHATYQATWFQLINLVTWGAKRNTQVYNVTT